MGFQNVLRLLKLGEQNLNYKHLKLLLLVDTPINIIATRGDEHFF